MSVISSPLHRQQGYTLIELAVVVAIVAVLIAGGLSSYQRFNHAQRIKVTNDHLDIIEKALVDYFNANRFLPCPALNTANYLTGSFNASVYTSPNCATPRGAGGSPSRWKRPSVRLSRAMSRSPCSTWISTLL